MNSQETINTIINTQNQQYTNFINQQGVTGHTLATQSLMKNAPQNFGTMKKSGQSVGSQRSIARGATGSLNHQYSHQSSVRSHENKLRHVQILKSILKQAKKQKKEQKKFKQQAKRKNTLLKRGGKMISTFTKTFTKSISQFLDKDTQGNQISDDSEDEIEYLQLRQNREMAGKLLFMPDSSLKNTWDLIVLLLIIQQFWIDLISSLPYDFIFDSVQSQFQQTTFSQTLNNDSKSGTPAIFKILKILRFMRVFKLLRIFKLQRIIIAVEEYIVSDEVMFVLRFAKIMVTIIFFAHWMACMYFAVGYQQLDSVYESWIISAGIRDSDLATQYVNSLYWAIQTMCTVGAEILSSGIYAITLNSVSQMVLKYNNLAVNYREKMMYVNQFMNQQELPKDLKVQVWRYLQHIWEIKKQIKIEEAEVFEALNEDLSQKITEGSLENKIYYLNSGRVAAIHRQSFTYLEDLIKDDYFGEIGFFSDKIRCITMKARDFTEVYSIDAIDFLQAAQNYQDVINFFHNMSHLISQQDDYSKLKMQCYVCKRVGHIAIDCYSFEQKKGNLIQIYNKLMKRPADYLSESMIKLQKKLKEQSSPDNRNTRQSVGTRIEGFLLDKTSRKNGSNSDFNNDPSQTGKSKSLFGKSFEQIVDNQSAARLDSRKSKKSSSKSNLTGNPMRQASNDSTRRIKVLKMQGEIDNDLQGNHDFSITINGKINNHSSNDVTQTVTVNEIEQTTISPINQRRRQSEDNRQRRKSLVYETLIQKIRKSAILSDNTTILEENSDSFRSSVSDLDENNQKSFRQKHFIGEEIKLDDQENRRMRDIFSSNQNQSSNNSIYEQLRLPYRFGNTLHVVPEENESLYSHVFGNQQQTNDSQSRKDSNQMQSHDNKSTHQYNNQTSKLRLPSFKSSTSKNSSKLFRRIQTTAKQDGNLINQLNPLGGNLSLAVPVTPKLQAVKLQSEGHHGKGDKLINEQDNENSNSLIDNLNEFQPNSATLSVMKESQIMHPKKSRLSCNQLEQYPTSPMHYSQYNSNQLNGLLHFQTVVKDNAQLEKD